MSQPASSSPLTQSTTSTQPESKNLYCQKKNNEKQYFKQLKMLATDISLGRETLKKKLQIDLTNPLTQS
jgi:hypothetical protein